MLNEMPLELRLRVRGDEDSGHRGYKGGLLAGYGAGPVDTVQGGDAFIGQVAAGRDCEKVVLLPRFVCVDGKGRQVAAVRLGAVKIGYRGLELDKKMVLPVERIDPGVFCAGSRGAAGKNAEEAGIQEE
jgi:hypothetical protein